MPEIRSRSSKSLSMTIDPGVNGTGVAIWDSHAGVPNNKIPIFANTMSIGGRMHWRNKVESYMHTILSILDVYSGCNYVYIEEPIYMESAKGQVSARSDALEKLIYCASFYAGYLTAMNQKVEFIRIIDWKGNMPKDVVERRIRKILGDSICENIHNHAWDAVGIGLHLQGLF